MSSPFSSPPSRPSSDPLTALLAHQSFSLQHFCFDFLSHESDHRDWSNLVGALAGGVPLFPLPFAQVVRAGSSVSMYVMPYFSVPFRLPLRLSPGHEVTLMTEVPMVPDLAPALEGATDQARIMSTVSGVLDGEEDSGGDGAARPYQQWLGLSRYSGHGGLHVQLRPRALSALHPSLSVVAPAVSVSCTASTHHDHLHLSHSSARLHLRPFAGSGDRGLLSAEGVYAHFPGEEGVNARLLYTHRISERPSKDVLPAAVRETVAQANRIASSPVGERAQQQVAGRGGALQSLRSSLSALFGSSAAPAVLRSPWQPIMTSVRLAAFAPRVPAPWVPSWTFPAHLSVGAAYFFSMSPQPQPYRLLDSSYSHLLRPLSLACGLSAEVSTGVLLQGEVRFDDDRLSGDAGVLWKGARGRRGWSDDVRWFLTAGAVRDRKDPTQSHVQTSLGIAVNW